MRSFCTVSALSLVGWFCLTYAYFILFGHFKILCFLLQLLKRVFDIMRAKNPTMTEGGKKKFVMKPPQVVRIGTKKTSFVNFADICRILHRQPKHLLAFLLAELGTRFLDAFNYMSHFIAVKSGCLKKTH